MHVPPGLRAVHPVGHPQGGRPARSSASAGSRIRCRPSGRWPRATATSSAWCGARSPTPSSRPRPAPAPPTTSACACRATRSASGAWASTAGSAASRTRAPGRERDRRRSAPRAAGGARQVLVVGAGPAGLQAAIAAARNGHDVTVLRAGAPSAGGQVRLAAPVPNRAEFGDLVRNQLHECRRLGVDDRATASASWPGLVERARPDARGRGHRRRAGPALVGAARRRADGGRRARRRSTARGRSPSGDGRGRSTRSASTRPRRWPSCWPTAAAASRWSPPAWSSARTSASPSTWRTGGCGPRPRASCRRPTSCRWAWRAARLNAAAPPDRRERSRARPTGSCWPCPPSRSSGSTTTCKARRASSVERVGDCVAPRRAHAAVIEGERVGAAL